MRHGASSHMTTTCSSLESYHCEIGNICVAIGAMAPIHGHGTTRCLSSVFRPWLQTYYMFLKISIFFSFSLHICMFSGSRQVRSLVCWSGNWTLFFHLRVCKLPGFIQIKSCFRVLASKAYMSELSIFWCFITSLLEVGKKIVKGKNFLVNHVNKTYKVMLPI